MTTATALALTARTIQRSEARIPKLATVIRGESLALVAVLALSATLKRSARRVV